MGMETIAVEHAAGTDRVGPRRRLRGRVTARALRATAGVLQRLPDSSLHRAAHAVGGLLYALQPGRRALVRENLRRVCVHLAAHQMATPAAAAAALDEGALRSLTRQAFGHYVRGYLEGAILPVYARPQMADRITADDPALVEQAFGPPGSPPPRLIVVALHYGAIEIPALWATRRRGMRVTAPMESVGDPDLQAYFALTRGATGLRIVPLPGAARELSAALARGESVAIVADRVIGGAGARVELFGAEARLPLGPALLALESGAPAWLVTARRTGHGFYRAHLELIPLPATGERRERIAAFLAAQARAVERAVALAPEQWWALFFPIWPEARRR